MALRIKPNKLISSGYNYFLSNIEEHFHNWIKLAVVLTILSASFVIGYKASPKWALLSGLLVCGFLGFMLFLRRPEIGIFLLVPISFFVPWEVGTGTSIAFNFTFLFSIAIIGIWIFKVITSREPNYPQSTVINIMSIVFVIVAVISLIGGNIHWVMNARDNASLPAQLGGWLLYVLPIGVMLFTQAHLKEVRWLKILVWIFIILGSINIISYFPPNNFLSRLNLFAPRSTDSVYWTWLAALVFGQLLFNNELQIRYKVPLGLLLIAIIAAGLSTNQREWTSGWLPPLIAIGIIFWLRSWRMGLVATLIAIIAYLIATPTIISDLLISTNQYSIVSRFATYPIMFELIKANPLIGLGFANYSYYTSLYPILGWYVSFNSHNNYMDIIAQTGFVGLISFFGLMIGIGLRVWKLHKVEVDGFSRGYIYACLGGLIGTLASGMLGDWFLPYLYNIGIRGFRSSIYMWIFLGGLLALGRIIDKKSNPSLGLVNHTE